MDFSCVYKTLRLQWLVLAFEEDLQGRLRTREEAGWWQLLGSGCL
ncbi:MAG: hypothetical protein ACR2N1_01520 [Rubripirellula sp.]